MVRGLGLVTAGILFGLGSGCEIVFGIEEKTLGSGPGGGPSGSGNTTGAGGGTCKRLPLFPDSSPFCSDGQVEVDCDDSAAREGQDGKYFFPEPSYAADPTDEEWVLDRVTGLLWARATQTVADANDFQCLHPPAGEARVPPFIDLLSIVDFGSPTPPAAHPGFFTSPKELITSETSSAGQPLTITFADGKVAYGNVTAYELRCEAGELFNGDPDLRDFVPAEDGVSTYDPLTGLTWQVAFEEATRWTDAIQVCEDLDAPEDGCTDWRLPSVKELLTLVAINGRMHQEFFLAGNPDPLDLQYWSSSFVAASPSDVWTVRYGDPVTGTAPVAFASATQGIYVRCVR